ncbi:hypothetical protein Daus18300_013961 [Diaporthe australafricana]|uniref:CENP-V/GFA domain-containing protein n=1 Tax=Diaporthe australafricana TaxID=127596 RepID=A0ABR3VX31_9PEZI
MSFAQTMMTLTISCLCGTSRQELKSRLPYLLPSDAEVDRHGSGVLFVSHLAIDPPDQEKLSELSKYDFNGRTRFFSVAGKHGFFTVATGVIVDSPDEREGLIVGRPPVDDTRDGGLGPWLPLAEMKGRTQKRQKEELWNAQHNSIPASCGCGNVQLLVQRPLELLEVGTKSHEEVRLPWSPYSDLMCPFKTTSKDKLDNPSDEKWYLCGTGEDCRYLAGTCACKSCRLGTGYEIQTWAFIPRMAISICVDLESIRHGTGSSLNTTHETNSPDHYIPLDFEALAALPDGRNPLRSYESSPGVSRELCHNCGATVFWHSKVRPELIDFSVGLLQASEGARAESLLGWWRDRCSFAEDAGLDRKGWVKDWAEGLIHGLEEGMKSK